MRVLAGHGEGATDVLLAVCAKIPTGQGDAACLGIEEAQEQVDDRRLPRAARSDERDPLARARAGG